MAGVTALDFTDLSESLFDISACTALSLWASASGCPAAPGPNLGTPPHRDLDSKTPRHAGASSFTTVWRDGPADQGAVDSVSP